MVAPLLEEHMEQFAYPGLKHWFQTISEIPRGSYHEEKIADFLVTFAKERDLLVTRDKAHNVLIRLPASVGREKDAAVLLQGHTDMVCQKREGSVHDFEKDPLLLYEEDGWLHAHDTTLGADNGVAVAVMLYILDGAEGNLPSHPMIECLFTSAEEVGLVGVKQFDFSQIKARTMINLDSAEEELLVVGCAAAARTELTIPFSTEKARGAAYQITVGGLMGGHSGEDIWRGRASANALLGRCLCRLAQEVSFRLVTLSGGTADNAIPRHATAVIVTEVAFDADAWANNFQAELSNELVSEDKGCFVTIKEMKVPDCMMTKESTDGLCLLLGTLFTGVLAWHPIIPSLVSFSRNLGIITTNADSVSLAVNTRSAEDSQLDWSLCQLELYAKALGATIHLYNRYPSWSVAEESPIRERYCEAYAKILGKKPIVKALHAGLEAGVVKQHIPEMDVISCGPTVENLHSPDERMNMKSFENFFRILCLVLK